jgi:hypothetical protein
LGSFFSSVMVSPTLAACSSLDAGNDVAHLARFERVARLVGRREHAQVVGVVGGAGGHHLDALTLAQATVHHAHQHHHTHIAVEPAVDDHRAQGLGLPLGAAPRDDRFEDVVDAHAGLGRTGDRIVGIDADHVLDLGLGVVGIGIGQIHLVEHRHHLHAQVQRGVAVGHRLRLDTLAGIDHQQRALAGRQRTAHFVGEVHMARRVDQVEVVDLPSRALYCSAAVCALMVIPRSFSMSIESSTCSLISRSAQPAATLDQAVCQRRLAVIDVRND